MKVSPVRSISTNTQGRHVLWVYFVAGLAIGQRSSRFSQLVRLERYLESDMGLSGPSTFRSPPLSKPTKLCSKNDSDWGNSPRIFLYPNRSGTTKLLLPKRLRSGKIHLRRCHSVFDRSSRKEAGQQSFGGRSISTADIASSGQSHQQLAIHSTALISYNRPTRDVDAPRFLLRKKQLNPLWLRRDFSFALDVYQQSGRGHQNL
jgi:hypothetical protein